MATGISDTHPEAERVHTELLRQAGTARRLALALSLSHTVIDLSRKAIAEANPALDQRGQRKLFLEVCYGRELAERVIAYMDRLEHAG
jgi:hypothetical protein